MYITINYSGSVIEKFISEVQQKGISCHGSEKASLKVFD